MTWTVVEFLETHEVEAVPSSWLYEDEETKETKCFWPPYEADKVEKEIKNNTEANTCWPLYEVRIFKNSTFGDYQKARLKSIKAQETSDLSNSTNDGKRKRKKKRPISSSDDEEEGSILPVPPSLDLTAVQQHSSNISIKKISTEKGNHKYTIYRPGIAKEMAHVENVQHSMPIKKILTEKGANQFTNRPDHRESRNNCKCCPIHQLNKIELLLSQVVEGQKNIRAHILQLRDDVKGSELNILTANDSLSKYFDLPISHEINLEALEEYLQEKKMYDNTVVELSKFGGRDLYDFLRRCLSTVLKNSLAAKYSYYGRKDKKAFNKLKLNRAILDAAQFRRKFDQKKYEESVAKWLKRAKKRKE